MEKVQTLYGEFVPEQGCPVAVVQTRCDLELDPFDAPVAARIYIDYRNISSAPISAVKFRIRFVDAEGKDKGTFHAPDAIYLPPGTDRSQKWRHERIDPRTTGLKVRVLQVKLADGQWESARLQELPQAGQADPPAQQQGRVGQPQAPNGSQQDPFGQ